MAHKLPTTLKLEAKLDLVCSDDGPPRFTMVANTGVPMRINGFFDPVIIDIKGLKAAQVIPILKDHKVEVGHATSVTIDRQSSVVTAEGVLSVPNEATEQIVAASKNGFPWQASIGAEVLKTKFLEAGETAKVNGLEVTGPMIIAKKTATREITIVAVGADSNTSVAIAATKPLGDDMEFGKWLQAMGLDIDDLDDDQQTKLKAKHEAELKASSALPPLPKPVIVDDDKVLEASRAKQAGEEERVDSIRTLSANFEGDLNADYLKAEGYTFTSIKGLKAKAIKDGWTEDRFELQLRRAEQPSVGHIGIHTVPDSMSNGHALSCALSRGMGMKANETNPTTGRKYGYEVAYDEKTLEASDKIPKTLGLLTVLEEMYISAKGHRYSGGRLNTPGFIQEMRPVMKQIQAEGFTTWSGLNIFDDIANKALWASYEAVETTWQMWVKQMSVNDFKTHAAYRLTMTGGYRELGAGGELKHGGFTDDKFPHSASTFGQIVGLTRTHLINDDLGALNDMMAMLGTGGAQFLEELYYSHLLENITVLFPTGDENANYIEGAATDLGVEGLTLAEEKASNQVDGNNRPILTPVSMLLVGNQDKVNSAELFTQTQLQGVQTANAKKRPDGNPHVGKFDPVASGYHNNTAIKRVSIGVAGSAIPNQTQTHWLLVRPPGPMGGIVIGSFLNGQTRPTIESGDPEFDVLGLQWRAFHDAGADDGDPKWGVFSKGAA